MAASRISAELLNSWGPGLRCPEKYEPQPVEQLGFDAGRLRVRGWGLTRRVSVNDNVEGWFRPVGVLFYLNELTELAYVPTRRTRQCTELASRIQLHSPLHQSCFPPPKADCRFRYGFVVGRKYSRRCQDSTLQIAALIRVKYAVIAPRCAE
jgi:hypothetical protein